MNGSELLTALREQHTRLPTLMLTAFTDSAIGLHPDAIMSKPFLAEDLTDQLLQLLRYPGTYIYT
jgi:DNA-binding response OmpR family regulator